MAEPDAQHARIAELADIVERTAPNRVILRGTTGINEGYFDQKLRQLASEALAAAIQHDDSDPRFTDGLTLLKENGLNILRNPELNQQYRAILESDPDVRNKLWSVGKAAHKQSEVPMGHANLNAIAIGMKAAAEQLAARPTWESPICFVEGSEGLPKSEGCLPPALREKKSAHR